MKVTITGTDLERTDEELAEEFARHLAKVRISPPRRGQPHAEWHDAVYHVWVNGNKEIRTNPRTIFAELVNRGHACDVSNGITDQKIRIGDSTVGWDTFQAYCYRLIKRLRGDDEEARQQSDS